MKRSWRAFVIFMLIGALSPVYADIYSWTDRQGTVHFSEDLGIVPVTLRKQVRTVEKSEPAPPLQGQTGKLTQGEQKSAATADAGTGRFADELFAGKSYEQWQKELADREAAMSAVRDRINEIALKLKTVGPNWEAQEKLLAEYKPLLAEFKELKVQYYQFVESARKAGLEVNIQ